MNITLKSTVDLDHQSVYNGFNDQLFIYLLPPGAKLIQYGGSEKGDVVHLKLPLAGEWISLITENGRTTSGYYFVDEGKKLPFPLKTWRHKHSIEDKAGKTLITDDMTFSTGSSIFDFLFYPVLYLAFLPRTWQYKNYFNQASKS